MKSDKEVEDQIKSMFQSEEDVAKFEKLMQDKYLDTKHDTGYFKERSLQVDKLILEEDLPTMLFRCAIDWKLIPQPKLVKPDDETEDEFKDKQQSVSMNFSQKKTQKFEVGDVGEVLENLLFVMMKMGDESPEQKIVNRRMTVVSLGRLEILLTALLCKIEHEGKTIDEFEKQGISNTSFMNSVQNSIDSLMELKNEASKAGDTDNEDVSIPEEDEDEKSDDTDMQSK